MPVAKLQLKEQLVFHCPEPTDLNMALSLKTGPLFFMETFIHLNKHHSILAASRHGTSYDLPCTAQRQNEMRKGVQQEGGGIAGLLLHLIPHPCQGDENIPKTLTCRSPEKCEVGSKSTYSVCQGSKG